MYRCLHLAALLLLASACTVIFQTEENELGDTIEIHVGPSMEFATYDSWKTNRKGDLTQRQFMKIEVLEGALVADEDLVGQNGACSGQVRAHAEGAVVAPISNLLTLDLDDKRCEVGDLLESDSGAIVNVLATGSKGVKEVVVIDRNLDAPIVISEFSTDASSYLSVRAGKRHGGIPDIGIVVSSTDDTPNHGFDIQVAHTRLEGFEITNWAVGSISGSSKEGVHVVASPVILNRLLIHHDGGDNENSNADGIYGTGDDIRLTVRNSFIYNIGRSGILLQAVTNGLVSVENCTLANCMLKDEGLDIHACVALDSATNTQVRAINTLVLMDSTTVPTNPPGDRLGFIVGTSGFHTASTNNASSDNTAPSLNALIVSSDQIKEDSGPVPDLHLVLGSLLADAGSNLASTPLDIDGDIRSNPWSIGADQLVP